MITYLKKMVTGIIDAFISIIIFSLLSRFFPAPILHTMWVGLIILFIFAIYRLICLILFKATLGMKICSIKLLNGEKETLSTKETLFAAFFILIDGVDYYNERPSL
jgi:RDD family